MAFSQRVDDQALMAVQPGAHGPLHLDRTPGDGSARALDGCFGITAGENGPEVLQRRDPAGRLGAGMDVGIPEVARRMEVGVSCGFQERIGCDDDAIVRREGGRGVHRVQRNQAPGEGIRHGVDAIGIVHRQMILAAPGRPGSQVQIPRGAEIGPLGNLHLVARLDLDRAGRETGGADTIGVLADHGFEVCRGACLEDDVAVSEQPGIFSDLDPGLVLRNLDGRLGPGPGQGPAGLQLDAIECLKVVVRPQRQVRRGRGRALVHPQVGCCVDQDTGVQRDFGAAYRAGDARETAGGTGDVVIAIEAVLARRVAGAKVDVSRNHHESFASARRHLGLDAVVVLRAAAAQHAAGTRAGAGVEDGRVCRVDAQSPGTTAVQIQAVLA